jgi:hypothetical protein
VALSVVFSLDSPPRMMPKLIKYMVFTLRERALKAGIENISQTAGQMVRISCYWDPHDFGLIIIKSIYACQEIYASDHPDDP